MRLLTGVPETMLKMPLTPRRLLASVMRTSALSETVSGTFQLYVIALLFAVPIRCHVAPLSSEYSSVLLLAMPLPVQVI